MRTGITQEQVNAAADAILGAGENPTVEKIRAALGTGSPNTVTRMLDAWRNRLGERLREMCALPDVPGSVGQAMVELWRLAVDHADREVTARLTNEGTALESARAELVREKEGWETRLQAADAETAKAKAALELAERARAALDTQLQDNQALRADLVRQRDRLQAVSDQQALEIKELRVILDERDGELRRDREQKETYIRNVEDRAHQEIDRARLDARQWQHRFETLERAHQSALVTIQTERDLLRDQLRRADNEVARSKGIASALEKSLAKGRTAAPQRSKAKGVVVADAAAKRSRKMAARAPRKP
ncbi:plasmid replication DNA-binding protein KfrA [Luteibacter sp. OK325]|uniref:DNA-binding protein n=1 Tax=Luteibacter sp. OK325 TaxID=2135670 RepID=UPI000D337896|nr:DNA-binding protein [Luteibacter sp. OK325]PTR34059.1 plasmid replication DNA-binding protein KfrA [Luteibacter sp. OK325]